jgi:chromosome segregation ATPase
LEDVWGQIEHSLRYKRKRLGNTDASSPESARLETTLRHLGALKTMIDGIAQYGDQIKLQIDELEPELRSTTTKVAEEVSARLGALRDLPDELKNEIAAAVASAKPALSGEISSPEARIRVLRTALARLDMLADAPDTLPDLKTRTRKESRYIITMQRALMHFQLGNLLP